VGFGCTTCIGNSGALVPEMIDAIENRGILPVTVLSGNRNFPGRVHPQIEASFLASPPLVIAYALAGHINLDILHDPIDGKHVYLQDLWPTGAEIDAALASVHAEDFHLAHASAEQNEAWRKLDAPTTSLFPWSETSTYIRRPPFASRKVQSRLGSYKARPLIIAGDDITTDHISPAGQIPAASAAAEYLVARGEDPRDLNVFASRRGNWEVMVRGTFTNESVHNLLDPEAQQHQALVIVAGERYGTGSSRDWAAKGPWLLGVRAVLALSFERIHRSNLIGMGILPLELTAPLPITLGDEIEIRADAAALSPRAQVTVTCHGKSILATAAVETALEVELLRVGGILPYILRSTGK
jgi:aconitate hydratase